MFFHLYKYSLKTLVYNREIMFWTLIFPVILASFMYFAFGNQMDTVDDFTAIPVAVVEEQTSDLDKLMLEAVSDPEKDPLIQVKWVGRKKAEKLLTRGKVDAIIYVNDTLSLTVSENGVEQFILAKMLDSMEQYKQAASTLAMSREGNQEDIIASLMEQTDCLEESLISDTKANPAMNFFYAILAFTCLFSALAGCDRSLKLQSEDNVVAQRRGGSAVPKQKMLLADFLACETIQYGIACLLFLYMRLCLGLNFGDQYPAMFLLLFIETSFGIVFGFLVGMLGGLGTGMKIAIFTTINLIFCTMSDLMLEGVKDWIEHYAAWMNRINPAALLSDAFYVLKVYDSYGRFWRDLSYLSGITMVLVLMVYLCIRRRKRGETAC